MLGPMDEFPVHQIPQPIAWPGSSDRNFYDRCYFNAHDRTGDIFLITGIGYYPNLGVKDAFVLGRDAATTQTAVHLSDAIDQDRLNQNVGNYRVEVIEPLHKLRIIWTRPRASPSTSPGTGCSTSCRSNATSCAPATGSPWMPSGSPNWVRGAGISRSTARRSPSTRRCGSAAATGRGASGRSARPNPPGGRPTRRSRACGGCTCRWRSTTSRSCSSSRRSPAGSARSTTARGSGRTAASSNSAGRG